MLEAPNTYFDLFLGYSAIWLLVSGYMFSLSRKSKQMSNNLDQISNSLKKSPSQEAKRQQECNLQERIKNCSPG